MDDVGEKKTDDSANKVGVRGWCKCGGKKGKEKSDYEVECALKKRAEGYDVWEEEEVWSVELNKWIPVKRKKKHIPADTTATTMWLRNRQPNKWRDKPEPVEFEKREDSGLIKALKQCASGVFDDGDDSEMLPEEEG